MNKYENMLLIGNERTSLSITHDGAGYFYYTDKFADTGLSQGAAEPTQFRMRALRFSSFEEAIQSMLSKYDVFNLYPSFIHTDYLEMVSNLFEMKKAGAERIDDKALSIWEMFFNNLEFDYDFDQIKDRKPDYAVSDSCMMMPPELKQLIEKQLLADLAFYINDVTDVKFDWSECVAEGHCAEYLNPAIEDFSDIYIYDSNENLVAKGWMDFIAKHDDEFFIAYWKSIKIYDANRKIENKSEAVIPIHIWEILPEHIKEYCTKMAKRGQAVPPLEEFAAFWMSDYE
jgi:hypothetical protein